MNEEIIESSSLKPASRETALEAPTQMTSTADKTAADMAFEAATRSKRHLLLPVDDTNDSTGALNWAIATFPKDVFHLVHVVPEPQMIHVWAGQYIPPDDDAELEEVEDTKRFVSHRFAKQLMEKKIPFKLHVIVGSIDPKAIAHVLNEKAKDVDAFALIIARHNKSALKELFVGSVTMACIKDCTVPVIVVPRVAP